MKKKVFKLFYDFEKEEHWLNQMAQKGWAFKKYTPGCYTFESCDKGQYSYRIEFLKHGLKHEETKDYLQFLEETGITCVSSVSNWVYLRKAAEKGSFNLFSDIDSRILHYKRIKNLWIFFTTIEFVAVAANLILAGVTDDRSWINLSCGVILLPICILFARMTFRLIRKINQLESERLIRE
ncbi:DUF2812 domain-containing protein [Sporolactobacillus laevolacticus]|nr:DUF2812 domain-containing protein [Sporolactobacillus laevolacticus]